MAVDSIQLPVHGSTAIEILKHDHQVIARLLTALTQATTTEARRDALAPLKAALVVHNATEENLVYPALRTLASKKAESHDLYHQTAEADALIFELDLLLQKGADAEFDAKVQVLQAAVVAHVASEETSAVREFRNSFRFVA